MISGLQRIDLFYWIISLNLKPCSLSLFKRTKFICSGTTLFAMERVYLMVTQKAGLRGKGKGIRVKKTLLISDMGIYRLWSKVRKKFRQEEIKLWIY